MSFWTDNQLATVRAYDSGATRYAEESRDREGLGPLRERLISLLPREPLILDLGSGPGHDAALLVRLGASVVCVDPAIELLVQGLSQRP